MRLAIFLGLFSIAFSIDPIKPPYSPEDFESGEALIFIIIVFFIMDVVEFFKNLRR
jgi:hypothetical protein